MRVLLAALAALGVLAAGLTLWAQAPAASQVSGGPAVPVPAAAPVAVVAAPVTTPAERAPACRFSPGQRLSYRYDFRSTARVALEGLEAAAGAPGPLPSLDLSGALGARLDLEVLSATDAAAVLVGRYREVTAPASMHPEELTAPFLVEVDARCELRRFAHHTQAPLRGARSQQALLWETAWRFVAAEEPFASQNGTGAYTAVALAVADEGGVVLHRRIRRYEQLWGAEVEGVTPDAVVTVRPGAGPWFETLDASERVALPSQERATSVSLRRLPGAGEALGVVSLADFTWANLLPQDFGRREPRPVSRVDRARREQVAALSPAQALATLTDKVTQRVGIEGQWPELSAWLEVHPKKTEEVVGALRREELPPEALDGFFIALGNARVPEARDALLALKRDGRAPPMIRVRATFSLLDREDVGEDLARELAQDAEALSGEPTRSEAFLANEALLALSTMAGLRGEPGVTTVAEASVRKALVSAPTPHRTRVALKALANLGDPKLLPLAEPYTRAVDWKTREAAARIFLRMKPAATNPVALAWLARERDPLVRRRLYRTVERQHFDAKATTAGELARRALEDLRGEESLMTRKALIRLLVRSEVVQEPAVRAVLKQQALVELEKGSGLLDEIAPHLTPEEVREVVR